MAITHDARPVSLLKRRPAADPEPEAAQPDTGHPLARVLEGLVLDDRTPAARRGRIRAARGLRALRAAATHDRTKAAGRLVVRHGAYVVGGGGIVVKRGWHARTVAHHQAMIRAALAAGDHATVAEWQERADRFRAERHRRRMDLATKAPDMVKSAAYGTVGTVGGLLVLGIAMAITDHRFGDVGAPLMWTLGALRTAVLVVHLVWGPVVSLLPFAAIAGLWTVGRQRQAAPAWALPDRGTALDVPITPSIVVKALQDLGIAELRKAIKDMADGAAGMLGPIKQAGCGVEVDVTLPSGVSTDQVMGRRRKLAENMHRHEHELHMVIPPAARTVRMWIADAGALDEPIGPSPLVIDPDVTASMHKGGAPWGRDLRGDLVELCLWQRHMLITGLSNQGKTASLRALALWLAFDPRVKFRIADLKGVGDWSMYQGIAEVLIEGPTDDHVIAATHMTEEGVAEMQRRIDLARQLREKGWTEEKIMADPRFDPLVLIIDEAQVAYACGARETFISENGKVTYGDPYGGAKQTSRYFQSVKKIHDQGRAVNVTIWEGTQNPTNQNLPVISREGNHVRASLVVGTESQSRMALGDAPVEAGAAPHKLRQGLDKGTCVIAGDGVKLPPGQPSITVRTHYISTEAAKDIAERAKARRAGVDTRAGAPVEERDHLADIAQVLGEQRRMRTVEVLQRLAELDRGVYGEWTPSRLKAFLESVNAEPHKSNGDTVVSRARVLDAIADRDEDGGEPAAEPGDDYAE